MRASAADMHSAGMHGADIQIDRIAIRMPGVQQKHGRELGREFGRELGREFGRELGPRLGALLADAPVSSLRLGPGETSLELLRIELTARPGEGAERLAARVAEQVSLLLGREALEAGR